MRRFVTDRSGASALETAVIAAALALALVAAGQALAPALAEALDYVAAAIAGEGERGAKPAARGRS